MRYATPVGQWPTGVYGIRLTHRRTDEAQKAETDTSIRVINMWVLYTKRWSMKRYLIDQFECFLVGCSISCWLASSMCWLLWLCGYTMPNPLDLIR